jgi:hypothetical protein
MRNMLRVALLSGALGLLPVAHITEAAEPVGGCGNAFELMTITDVLSDLAAPGFEDAIRSHDRNADEFLCIKISEAPGLEKLFGDFTPFAYTDNNVQRGG